MGAEGRVAGWSVEATRDKPILLVFDIAAAFPSPGRQWLSQALSQFQFEMGFVKAVAALCDQATVSLFSMANTTLFAPGIWSSPRLPTVWHHLGHRDGRHHQS
eukprot:8754452-Pyramimonas_sp.AAC.1